MSRRITFGIVIGCLLVLCSCGAFLFTAIRRAENGLANSPMVVNPLYVVSISWERSTVLPRFVKISVSPKRSGEYRSDSILAEEIEGEEFNGYISYAPGRNPNEDPVAELVLYMRRVDDQEMKIRVKNIVPVSLETNEAGGIEIRNPTNDQYKWGSVIEPGEHVFVARKKSAKDAPLEP